MSDTAGHGTAELIPALAAKQVEITAFPEALRPACDAIRKQYETPRSALMPILWLFQGVATSRRTSAG